MTRCLPVQHLKLPTCSISSMSIVSPFWKDIPIVMLPIITLDHVTLALICKVEYLFFSWLHRTTVQQYKTLCRSLSKASCSCFIGHLKEERRREGHQIGWKPSPVFHLLKGRSWEWRGRGKRGRLDSKEAWLVAWTLSGNITSLLFFCATGRYIRVEGRISSEGHKQEQISRQEFLHKTHLFKGSLCNINIKMALLATTTSHWNLTSLATVWKECTGTVSKYCTVQCWM